MITKCTQYECYNSKHQNAQPIYPIPLSSIALATVGIANAILGTYVLLASRADPSFMISIGLCALMPTCGLIGMAISLYNMNCAKVARAFADSFIDCDTTGIKFYQQAQKFGDDMAQMDAIRKYPALREAFLQKRSAS